MATRRRVGHRGRRGHPHHAGEHEALTQPGTSPHPRDIMNVLGLSPRKSMGQNFLLSGATLGAIVDAVGLTPENVIFEIGPGLGALTRNMAAIGAPLYALEKDRGLASYLETQFHDAPHVTIIQGDGLQWDVHQLPGPPSCRRLVANLPYNMAVPLIFRMLEPPCAFLDLHVMVQTEVANRMVAKPGTKAYGTLSVNLALVAAIEHVVEAPPEAFYPRPKVRSTVVRLIPHKEFPYDPGDLQRFRDVVRAGFGRRRKTLRNALSVLLGKAGAVGALEDAAIDPNRRAETLSLEEFCVLSRSAVHFHSAAGFDASEDRSE